MEAFLAFFATREMLQNLVAEAIGILVTTVVVDQLIRRRDARQEIRRWSAIRALAASEIGAPHRLLNDNLRDQPEAAWEVTGAWCDTIQGRVRRVRGEYPGAFGTIELVELLSHYTLGIRQLQTSLSESLPLNRAHLDDYNARLKAFLEAAGCASYDIDQFCWCPSDIDSIAGHLFEQGVRK